MPLAESNGGTLLSGCVLLRKPGRPAFDAKGLRIAHLVFAEAHPLHTLDLNADLADELAPLSARARHVLTLLIDGLSIKQVALELTLSPHTINDYCQSHLPPLQGDTRAELLRRFMTGGTGEFAGTR